MARVDNIFYPRTGLFSEEYQSPDMPGSSKGSGEDLPPSLRKFLTVTEPDGTTRTGRVEPSPLLSKMQAFLPQMAAANESLTGLKQGGSAVELEKVDGAKDSTTRVSTEDLSVNMDLYVDESLGELVGAVEGGETTGDSKSVSKRKDDKRKQRPPFIEVLGDEVHGQPKVSGKHVLEGSRGP